MFSRSTRNLEVLFFSTEAIHRDVDLFTPIKRVLESNRYILGEEVEFFEKEFASYVGVDHCVSLGNGTDALELSLRVANVQRGDPVLLVANAGFYGSTAIHLIGANPHYIDIDPVTLTMSVEKMQEALKIKPKAIIVTHLYGQLADIETICEIASKFNIPVIEDCAQAHGAKRHGKYAGSFGQLACFSFYPTKNLGALGDGGAVATQDKIFAEKLKQFRQYGWKQKYSVEIPLGRNSRLDEMQAAILREKLPLLNESNNKRRAIAQQYNTAFFDLPIVCPKSIAEDNVVHLYTICIEDRDNFRAYLKNAGIHTDIHYPIADHLQSAYPALQKKGMLPATEYACEHIVSLPCYPNLNPDQINAVISAVKAYFKR